MATHVDNATEALANFGLTGHAPNACMIVCWGDINDPDKLFPANEFTDLELQLTGEASVGAIRVVTQQLRM